MLLLSIGFIYHGSFSVVFSDSGAQQFFPSRAEFCVMHVSPLRTGIRFLPFIDLLEVINGLATG